MMKDSQDTTTVSPVHVSPGQEIVSVMGRLAQVASVDAVFGQPHAVAERTLIPASVAVCGLGFGFGSGSHTDSQAKASGGGGGAGGGGARSWPVAVIVASPEGVRVEPVLDVTQIGPASIVAVGFAPYWVARLLRGAVSAKGGREPGPDALAKAVRM
jgi:uncharacterized spore protein YtfJ